jgi:uncharacterized repeat protein (TIGR01451 family)
LPWTSQSGTTYSFDLGTVAAGQCGSFKIIYRLDCDNAIGTTLCVKAHIYPDSICTPADTTWDKSSVRVEGECVGDSVRFVIYNTGEFGDGNMDAPSQYRIYVNDTLYITKNFQLQGQDSLVIFVTACGNTIRLEADQRPGHPGNSRPRVTVEGCGSSCGTVQLGHVNTVAEDDADDFVEEDCQVVRGSNDPNEKLVKPTGITANKYISKEDELEYQINFQNTGNDTAFLVVLRDTLNDNVVEIGSVVSGVSSHPYTFRIYGQGILEWTFKNILLPDSNMNEAASHGYVKFKVRQAADNAKGTKIENKGAIYFDFNAPVITNTAQVTVYDTTIVSGIKDKYQVSSIQYQVEVYPNPFSRFAHLRITNLYEYTNKKLELRIYDVLGREVKHLTLNPSLKGGGLQGTIERGNLPDGLYFYKITSPGGLFETGKIVIQE